MVLKEFLNIHSNSKTIMKDSGILWKVWIPWVSNLLLYCWRCCWNGCGSAKKVLYWQDQNFQKGAADIQELPHPCCCCCLDQQHQQLHFWSQRQEVSLLPPAFWSPASVSWCQNLTGSQLARRIRNIISRIPVLSIEWSTERWMWR